MGPVLSAENFRWSIAGNEQGRNPDILSELRLTALKRAGILLEGGCLLGSRFSLTAAFAGQYGFSGRVTDVDYAGNGRSIPVAFHQFGSRGDHTAGYRLQGLYQVIRQSTVTITAGGGYFISKTRYRTQERSGARTKGIYDAQWQGPLLAMELRIQLPQNWMALAGISGQKHTYKARGNWIHRTDFSHPLSFIHQAKGLGGNGWLALQYQIGSRACLQLRGSLQQWATGNGKDLLFMADGTQIPTRMNESVKTQMEMGLRGVFNF
ncbi:hypothetical protein [Niabella drilacis]|uniref:hypothetical protein n=1 Tax=Niabella drilacis (strain DSM 25811 / CCM 8410 / CCUG 62505 / LMG 26954 / E90) TaxID=1285928 RepID=UPI00115FA0E5|nr:hypothetical protein [Niabella drilacis]